MKKNIILIVILSLSIVSTAQKKEYMTLRHKYMWGYFGLWGGSDDYNKKIPKAGISGYVETIKKDDKEYVSAKSNCDNGGNTLSYVYFRKNGNPVAQYAYSYNADTNIISQTYKRKKDQETKKINLSYDEFKNTTCEEYYKKSTLKAKTIFKYDSAKIFECFSYKNSKPGFHRKWIYSYYPDKSRKSSTLYNAKGKIIHTWNYECKPEGELQSKHKDTTDVCKKVKTDSSGNKIITERKFDEKGKVIRVVYAYDKGG